MAGKVDRLGNWKRNDGLRYEHDGVVYILHALDGIGTVLAHELY